MHNSHSFTRSLSKRLLLVLLMISFANLSWGSSHSTKPKIGLQLWSIRNDVHQEFEKTLTEVAAMGFEGVEFAGDFGPYVSDPKGLKQLLNRLGLSAFSAHVSIKQLNAEHFSRTVKFYQELGCKNLVIPNDKRAGDPIGVKKLIKDLNQLAQQLKPFNMQIGFHNHAVEMGSFEGKTYWDAIAQGTPNEVILQQDVGWTSYVGKNPAYYIKRYPGRTVSTHFKSKLPNRDIQTNDGKTFTPLIGQDTIDWAALYQAVTQVGGTAWIIVEQEDYPNGLTPMQSVEKSLQGLRTVISEQNNSALANANSLNTSESANGWKLLFDGHSVQGWHGYGKNTVGEAWQVKNGELRLDASKKDGWQTQGGGDIVSNDEYDNFHLQLDWKINSSGNSGIFFFVNEDRQRFPYTWSTGLEMQVLDNASHSDGKSVKHRAGDLYDLISSSQEAALPPGQWNHVEIVCDQGELNFFLNGIHIVNTRLWDEQWAERVKKSKFVNMPGFGESKKGRIGLQDHGDEVSFRNIKIKSL